MSLTNPARASGGIDIDMIKRSQIPADKVDEQQAKIDAAVERTENEPATDRGLPPQATGPATAAEPVSKPVAATTAPATGLPPRTIGVAAQIVQEPSFIRIPSDPSMFPGHSPANAREMARLVPCQFIEEMKGCLQLKSYHFHKNDVYALPKWFALEHPKSIVIKEG